jgi:hypothetical protein
MEDHKSFRVVIELDFDQRPDHQDVLDYVNQLGRELDYKLQEFRRPDLPYVNNS